MYLAYTFTSVSLVCLGWHACTVVGMPVLVFLLHSVCSLTATANSFSHVSLKLALESLLPGSLLYFFWRKRWLFPCAT